MAVSVRMDPTLEQDLERAAKRQGITKSQFIVDAVERALGRKNSYQLLLKAHHRFALDASVVKHKVEEPTPAAPTMTERLKQKLQAKHDADMKDWLAFQAAKKRGEVWKPDDTPAPRRGKV